jgi:hypothetical protein
LPISRGKCPISEEGFGNPRTGVTMALGNAYFVVPVRGHSEECRRFDKLDLKIGRHA